MKKILYFRADWCLPCKNYKPAIAQIKETVPVEEIDVDYQPHLADMYAVKTIPTVLIIKDDVTVASFTGVQAPVTIIDAYKRA